MRFECGRYGCNKKFKKYTKHQRFCSISCQIREYNKKRKKKDWINKGEKIICAFDECENYFIKNRINRKFCSTSCQKKAGRKKYKKFSDFEIFAYDNFTCQYCGKTPKDSIKLVVDHIYPVDKEGEGDRFNLITSCEKCNLSKGKILLPKETIYKLWNKNKRDFTFSEMKRHWKSLTKRRIKNANI